MLAKAVGNILCYLRKERTFVLDNLHKTKTFYTENGIETCFKQILKLNEIDSNLVSSL